MYSDDLRDSLIKDSSLHSHFDPINICYTYTSGVWWMGHHTEMLLVTIFNCVVGWNRSAILFSIIIFPLSIAPMLIPFLRSLIYCCSFRAGLITYSNFSFLINHLVIFNIFLNILTNLLTFHLCVVLYVWCFLTYFANQA